jgi:hypothetical protein
VRCSCSQLVSPEMMLEEDVFATHSDFETRKLLYYDKTVAAKHPSG